MINKIVGSLAEAVRDVPNGATILLGGFAGAGYPMELIDALVAQGARDLTMVANHAGRGDTDYAALILQKRVKRVVCSFPGPQGSWVFQKMYEAGEVELELVPQGTLAERLRAGGAGLGGILTPVGVGTELAAGKQVMRVDGRDYLLELPLRGDFALVRAHRADRWGNLVYRKAGRNFNPVMAMAGRVTVAQVDEIVELGAIPAEDVHTPGIFVDRVVLTPRQAR